ALATSRPAYTASLVFTGRDPTDETRLLLRQILGITEAELDQALATLKRFPFQRARLRVDLTPRQQTSLEEFRHQLPGVIVETLPVREYPLGSLGAHVLGYLRQK